MGVMPRFETNHLFTLGKDGAQNRMGSEDYWEMFGHVCNVNLKQYHVEEVLNNQPFLETRLIFWSQEYKNSLM